LKARSRLEAKNKQQEKTHLASSLVLWFKVETASKPVNVKRSEGKRERNHLKDSPEKRCWRLSERVDWHRTSISALGRRS
jgi:hypothetical protein